MKKLIQNHPVLTAAIAVVVLIAMVGLVGSAIRATAHRNAILENYRSEMNSWETDNLNQFRAELHQVIQLDVNGQTTLAQSRFAELMIEGIGITSSDHLMSQIAPQLSSEESKIVQRLTQETQSQVQAYRQERRERREEWRRENRRRESAANRSESDSRSARRWSDVDSDIRAQAIQMYPDSRFDQIQYAVMQQSIRNETEPRR